MTAIEYTIYEQPQPPDDTPPGLDKAILENPTPGKDTKELRGANMYAKANSSSVIREMIEIATNKTFAENYAQKHNTDAKFGWYRYDTRFAIPVYDDAGELVRYNVFKARILVRHAKDGKLYLYDILRTKKETSKPLEQ